MAADGATRVPPRPARRSRGLAGGLGVALVAAALLHLSLVEPLDRALREAGEAAAAAPRIARVEVAFTRELAPATPEAAPPAAAPPPPRRPRPARQVAAAEPAASAPEAVAEAASAPVAEAASAPGAEVSADALATTASAASAASAAAGPDPAVSAAPPPPLAEAASAPAVAATPAAASAPAAPRASAAAAGVAAGPAAGPSASAEVPVDLPIGGLVWPRSTRLSYQLEGWFRGEITGSAQVEWLRLGADGYQVHLDVWLGARAAPLMRRRMSSEGRIGETGLRPQRFEQETQVLIGRNRRQALSFDAEGIVLADGRRVEPQAELQDSASQFIQLIYLLRTRPGLARPGQAAEFPLVLPNRVDRWTYEVSEAVTLDTPLGRLDTLHVKPRRRAPGGHLTAQMWYAPALQMLPVRIRLDQDEETWIDLKLERAPEQSGS